MFEMQVRCVWVILNNQVRVNFSTNCKFRHYICRFLTIRFPLYLASKCRKWHFRYSRFQSFRGSMPSNPLEISCLCPRFSRLRRSESSHKIARSTHIYIYIYLYIYWQSVGLEIQRARVQFLQPEALKLHFSQQVPVEVLKCISSRHSNLLCFSLSFIYILTTSVNANYYSMYKVIGRETYPNPFHVISSLVSVHVTL